jgi:hypothetical protein
MARPEKFTPAQVIAAIKETKGMLTFTAQRLGCTPWTISSYVKRYKSVRQALTDERERVTDLAELKLFAAINNGEPWAIRFYLTCQARSRGYAERADLKIEIQRVAEQVGSSLGMTAAEVLAEAEAYLREERDAR